MATGKRDPAKVKKILKDRGYPGGKTPPGKEVHHIKPVAEGGKDTPKNIKVVPEGAHKKIHKKRREKGEI